jgi:hypothetical protein
MCFNYRRGFEPESSNNLDDEFLIILTFEPSGMVRVTTLGGRLSAKNSPEQGQGRICRESSPRVKSKLRL